MLKFIYYMCGFLLLLPVTLFAADLGTLTLQEAVLLALRNNPQIQSAELNRVTQKFSLALAYHNFEPRFTLTGNASYTHATNSSGNSITRTANVTPSMNLTTGSGTTYNVNMNNTTGNYYNPQISATVTQPLLRGLGSQVVLQGLYNAIEQEQINRLQLRDTVITTINKVINDYYAIASAKRQLKIQELQLKQIRENVKANLLKIKAGQMAPSDNLEAKSQIASQQLSLVAAQNAVDQARQTLLQDLGITPETQFSIVDEPHYPDVPLPKLLQCQKMALDFSQQYQSLLINRRGLKRALLVAEDAKRWQLDLSATASVGGGSGGGANAGLKSLLNGLNNSRGVSLNLGIPVDLLQIRQAVINAKINLQNSQIQIHDIKRQTETQIINQYRDLVVQKERIRLALESRDLKQKVLDQAIKKQQFGRVSQYEVNQKRQDLINAQLTVVSEEVSYINKEVSFNSLIGLTLPQWEINIRY